MVLLLILDVFDHLIYVGLTHRKGSVAVLPVEISVSLSFRLDPLGRILFHHFDHITQWVVL